MGCNHCLEPSCLIGCPVEAYTKDPRTGVVIHDADTCIGCQYCTWNCSYGVPQYNPERGVVGKCDLCHHRLDDGMARRLLRCERARAAICARQYFDHTHYFAGKSTARYRTRRHTAHFFGASALAASLHAGGDATLGR
ncbi:MAG: 4Fe-4S dicluster domain-containing protein, partial [Terracidiphilus sp.]